MAYRYVLHLPALREAKLLEGVERYYSVILAIPLDATPLPCEPCVLHAKLARNLCVLQPELQRLYDGGGMSNKNARTRGNAGSLCLALHTAKVRAGYTAPNRT